MNVKIMQLELWIIFYWLSSSEDSEVVKVLLNYSLSISVSEIIHYCHYSPHFQNESIYLVISAACKGDGHNSYVPIARVHRRQCYSYSDRGGVVSSCHPTAVILCP